MQYVNIITLSLKPANQCDDPTESTGFTFFHRIDSIGVVQVNECQRAGKICRIAYTITSRRTGCQKADQHQQVIN